MLTFTHGDIFASNCRTLVNPVNCVGVMGAGLAKQFAKRFPQMCDDYYIRCTHKLVKPGEPYLYRQEPQNVLNFPTKRHWRDYSRLADIVAGLQHLEQHYVDWAIESLAVPALGCGLGGLPWEQVRPLLVEHLEQLTIPVELYAA